MSALDAHLIANVERFSGFAALYDHVRPQPPSAILDILMQFARVNKPRLVVDLGSGTGLSTRIWSERAEQVIGIEPSADMREHASTHSRRGNVIYFAGYAHQTGLASDIAEIITCSQSFHWMDPDPTLFDIARILRSGAVFAAYDNDWPPKVNREAESAFMKFWLRAEAMGEERGFYRGVEKWNKDGHFERFRASGLFRHCEEITLESVEEGDGERFVGLALSQGGVAVLLRRGVSDEEIYLAEFRKEIERTLGRHRVPFKFTYRVRLGIK